MDTGAAMPTLGREGGIGATNQGAVSQGEAVSLQPPPYHLPGQNTRKWVSVSKDNSNYWGLSQWVPDGFVFYQTVVDAAMHLSDFSSGLKGLFSQPLETTFSRQPL